MTPPVVHTHRIAAVVAEGLAERNPLVLQMLRSEEMAWWVEILVRNYLTRKPRLCQTLAEEVGTRGSRLDRAVPSLVASLRAMVDEE